jgi:hypothetical protein
MTKSKKKTETVPEHVSVLEASEFWDKHSLLSPGKTCAILTRHLALITQPSLQSRFA